MVQCEYVCMSCFPIHTDTVQGHLWSRKVSFRTYFISVSFQNCMLWSYWTLSHPVC